MRSGLSCLRPCWMLGGGRCLVEGVSRYSAYKAAAVEIWRRLLIPPKSPGGGLSVRILVIVAVNTGCCEQPPFWLFGGIGRGRGCTYGW